LFLANSAHELDAGDGVHRMPESLEAKHYSDALLDIPMVLFDQIVQVFDERSFVAAGSWPSAFSPRTAR
jgi:hypothetical protein